MVLSVIAVVVGIALADSLMPGMANLFRAWPRYALGWSATPIFWLFLCGLPILVGLLAGLYPAIVLSRTEPINALKGCGPVRKQGFLSRALIVTQFGVTVFLLATTWIILSQIRPRTWDRTRV